MNQTQQKRKYLRYPSSPLDVGHVHLNLQQEEFAPDYVGLIIEQSAIGGCCLAILNPDQLKEKQKCRVKLGELPPILAEVRWLRPLDTGINLIGFQFLE